MPDLKERHPHGLQFDLQTLQGQVIERRRLLGIIGLGGGAALLNACGGGGGSSSTSAAISASSSSSTASSVASSSSSASTSSSSSAATACIADPQATAGPYPADGSNSASGSTSDILTASGIVRSDIRASFISDATLAGGLPLTYTITLVDSSSACTPLQGYAIYLWHCDHNGDYSLYSAPAESYLRGVQVTDANGQVTFTTYFPACYSGRWPHIHFEIYKNLAAATTYANALLTSQFAMPQAVASSVYSNNSSLYAASTANLAAANLSTDNVFSAFTAAQLTQATPTMTASGSSGYAGTAIVGLAI